MPTASPDPSLALRAVFDAWHSLKDFGMYSPELAIVVTSYQMPWHLRRVLESIAAQRTSRPFEVIVSDDGSTDETASVVRAFAEQATFPVRFVTHPHTEFHAARCRNEGARHSSAPHLLFSDGDCLLPPDHVDQHMHSARPGVVTCSYCVRLDHAVSQHATLQAVRGGAFVSWATAEQRRKLWHMHWKSLWYGLIRHPRKPALRSGNFAISRDDYERVNGFDENFLGWGCEDDDFGRRLRMASIRATSILNRTCVYHLWHPPAPTRPQEWKRGGNVAYLQRQIRLARCINGLVPRSPRSLTARLVNETTSGPEIRSLLERHGWIVETSRTARTDFELASSSSEGRFTRNTDCRVFVCLAESLPDGVGARAAQIVLSPSGRAGQPGQVKLRLDDVDGFWGTVAGAGAGPHRAAA
jgi:glycosyltransferase involved in cell wall biosynthesis